MKKKLRALCIVLLTFCLYGNQFADKTLVLTIVQKELSLTGTVSVEKICSGMSGAQVFLVNNEGTKYIVCFMSAVFKASKERKTYNFSLASEKGCGSKVYYQDADRGILILEYLLKPNALRHASADEIYAGSAILLNNFSDSGFDQFRLIGYDMSYKEHVPVAHIERILTIIHQALLPHTVKAPCHKDLHFGNLIFIASE